MPRSIIIEGLIAAGKTTIAKELAAALGPKTLLLLEPAEGEEMANPYMKDYYKDPAGYSFKMQMFLLNKRHGFHKYAQQHVVGGHGDAVLDRGLYGDVSFANVQRRMKIMDDRDYATYRDHYKNITAGVLFPNFCIRMLVSPETSLERIKARMVEKVGRECEVGVSIEYLRMLDEEIDGVMTYLRSQGVVVLDVPWDTEREDQNARQLAVSALRDRILSHRIHDPFQSLHSRTM